MAHWNSKEQRVVTFAPEPWGDDAPGWERIDCGCCAGLQWTTGYECKQCAGSGSVAHHVASGVLALYPGGPLRGHALKPAPR